MKKMDLEEISFRNCVNFHRGLLEKLERGVNNMSPFKATTLRNYGIIEVIYITKSRSARTYVLTDKAKVVLQELERWEE